MSCVHQLVACNIDNTCITIKYLDNYEKLLTIIVLMCIGNITHLLIVLHKCNSRLPGFT